MDTMEYELNDLPKCPHCAADFPIWEGDNPLGVDYTDGGRFRLDCPSCSREFHVGTTVRYKFCTAVSEEAADDQEWGPTPG